MRPAHRNVLVMAARRQGLLRNVTELSAVACPPLVSMTGRRLNGQMQGRGASVDHDSVWLQTAS